MTFIYTPELWPDSAPSKHWFSGRYKITHYPRIEGCETIVKAHYRAYFKPTGWTNWGMGCEAGNPSYPSLTDAQRACARHATIGDYSYRETLSRRISH